MDFKFLKLLDARVFPGSGIFASAVAVKAELMEGIEDYEITKRSDLGSGNFYIACNHDLRIAAFYVSIPMPIYLVHKMTIDSSEQIYETEQDGANMVLKLTARTYLSTSFTYNRDTEVCDGYSVSHVRFK